VYAPYNIVFLLVLLIFLIIFWYKFDQVFDVMLHTVSPHRAEGASPPSPPQLHSKMHLHVVPCSYRHNPGLFSSGRVQGVVSSTGEMNRLFAVISCLGLSCDPRCESRLPIRDGPGNLLAFPDIRDASPDYRSYKPSLKAPLAIKKSHLDGYLAPGFSCDF
jgi:hypothetical protein